MWERRKKQSVRSSLSLFTLTLFFVPETGTEERAPGLSNIFIKAKKNERLMIFRFVNYLPRTGLFYEPFLRELELIWKIYYLVNFCTDS